MSFGGGTFGGGAFGVGGGSGASLVGGGSALVFGLLALTSPGPRGRPQYADILAPESLLDVGPGATLGSVVVDSSGDLAGADYRAALRTRVARKLRAARDAYAHLPGWGCSPPVKGLARPSLLAALELTLARDLAADPDVKEVQVTVTSNIPGSSRATLVDVHIVDRYGATVALRNVEV